MAEDECSLGKFDIQFSGSTCVLVFCIANKIICANAGDSRAILVTDHNKKSKNFISKIKIINKEILDKSSEYCSVISLSHDHKPDLDHEKSRILNHGGRVDKYNGIIQIFN